MKGLRLLFLVAVLLAVAACSVEFPTPTPTAAVIPLTGAALAPGNGSASAGGQAFARPSAPVAATATPAAAATRVVSPSPTFVLKAPLPTVAPVRTATPTAQAAAVVPSGPAAAALSGRIVLQTSSGGRIMTVSANGGAAATLTNGLDPVWSPDGTKIAFTRWSEPQGLYVMNADGGDLHMVFAINGAKSPTWSPDGTKIAFTAVYKQVEGRGRPGSPGPLSDYRRISVIDLAGGQKSDVMTDGDQQAMTPSWGPDGRFVYKGVRGFFLTTETGWPTALPENPLQQSPAWSPDGSKIAFMVDQHDHWDIAVMNSDGSAEKFLTSSPFVLFSRPVNNVAPAWSPDGKSIAFLSDREGDWRVYVMNVDGSNQRKMLDIAVTYEYAAEHVLSWTK
jgi:Tol biopolymer transport system component